MAAKRLAQSTFNWAALAERVPEGQKAQYLAFKTKGDNYARRMMANPENPPAIDWPYYVNTVPVPGLVEQFKQKYDSFQIPVPAVDKYYSELDGQEKDLKTQIAAFKTESDQTIAQTEKEIARVKALIPYYLMTYEELYLHSPEMGLDRKEPGFWPHYIRQEDMAESEH